MIRREFLQVGFSGFLGMTLPGLLTATKARGAMLPGRAKSVILVFLTGGPSHIDTFDPKPSAAEGIRGDFKTIATSVPGIRFTDQLPGLAAQAEKLAIVRSMSHGNTEPPQRDASPCPDRPFAAERGLRQDRLAHRSSRATPRPWTTSGPAPTAFPAG